MAALFRRASADAAEPHIASASHRVGSKAVWPESRTGCGQAAADSSARGHVAQCGAGPGGRNHKPIRSCYNLGTIIGTGNFSVVRIAEEICTGALVAVKAFLKGKSSKEEAYREIALLQKAQHVSVIRFLEYFEEESGGIFLVTELVSGREAQICLSERGSYAEEDCRTVARQLLRALEHLHRNGIAHRDLKLENVVFGEDDCLSTLRIIDFGLAGQLSKECPKFSKACGTPVSTAPEVLVQQASYGTSCDVWSLGCLLFTLLSGAPPFGCKPFISLRDLVHIIRRGRYSMADPAWEMVSESARDFVNSLLTVDPASRPTATAALLHPWLQE
eukprot:jgi/Tetstr1/438835/TSEL_027344.t1